MSRCPYKRGVTGRVTRPITKHSYNEYQTEIPLMGEIEIPRRSFLVNEQVDVYYIFLLSLSSTTCNHVYLQTRNSKNITGNLITKHRMSMSIELLVGYSPFKWHSVRAPLRVYYSTGWILTFINVNNKNKNFNNCNVTKNLCAENISVRAENKYTPHDEGRRELLKSVFYVK